MTDPSVRILFICTANVCRSPMAAAFFTLHAELNNVPMQVASASIDRERRELHPLVTKILSERNLVLRRTRSQPLSHELVDGADLILTMTAAHAVSVVGRFGAAKAKVFVLGHFAEIVTPPANGQGTKDWLDETRSLRRDYSGSKSTWDIPDPIGADEATFRAVARRIDELNGWIAAVFSSLGVEGADADRGSSSG